MYYTPKESDNRFFRRIDDDDAAVSGVLRQLSASFGGSGLCLGCASAVSQDPLVKKMKQSRPRRRLRKPEQDVLS